MSTFTPTISTLEPTDRPDNLSSAVLHSLSRPIYGRVAWNPVKSFFLGGITFGIAPLIAWPAAFARFITAEQQQFWYLLEWIHIRTGDKDALKLRDEIQRNGGPSTALRLIPILCLVGLVFNATYLHVTPRWEIHHLIDATYGARQWEGKHPQYPVITLFQTWNLWLMAGYFFHWLNVKIYVSRVNQMVRGLNVILARQQLPPLPLYGVGFGFRPLWLAAGFIGLAFGAVWAVPAAFAGAIHQRYCRRTSSRIRAELATRVVTALSRVRPAIDVPMPHGFRIVCRNPLCGHTIAGGAAYCPRCGTTVPRSSIA